MNRQQNNKQEDERVRWIRQQVEEEARSYADIGRELSISRQRVGEICKDHCISSPDTPEWHAKRMGAPELRDRRWLLGRKAQGEVGIRKMSAELGINATSLCQQIERLGLCLNEFKGGTGRKITLLCSYCGKSFVRYLSGAKKQSRFFCNRRCHGRWLAENYGIENKKLKEERFIRNNWQRMSDREMALRLKKSREALRSKRRRMGLKRDQGGKDE